MPPFTPVPKVLGSLFSRKPGFRRLINSARSDGQLSNLNEIRRRSGTTGIGTSSVHQLVGTHHNTNSSLASSCQNNAIVSQRRQFLGVSDGEEGDVLSKVYEEHRVLGYSPEQLFDIVAAVDLYHGFVPWCQRSEILKYYPDGSFDAALEIGFKFLVESYVSHVELNRPNCLKTTARDSSLFDHLINIWEFNPGPVPGTCNLYFLVDFKFHSPLYRQVVSMFFKEVVSRLVGSFNERCRLIYGPAVQIIEKSYEQRA